MDQKEHEGGQIGLQDPVLCILPRSVLPGQLQETAETVTVRAGDLNGLDQCHTAGTAPCAQMLDICTCFLLCSSLPSE